MGQLGLTGMSWCDFFVKCEEDYHLERIHFDVAKWEQMKIKLDAFFFFTTMLHASEINQLSSYIQVLLFCSLVSGIAVCLF